MRKIFMTFEAESVVSYIDNFNNNFKFANKYIMD
jgi:hypothetical protein